MNIRSKMRNIATKIMAMLMLAIYLTVSASVPVLAETENLDRPINSAGHGDVEVTVSSAGTAIGAYVGNSIGGDNVSADSLTVSHTGDSGDTRGIDIYAVGDDSAVKSESAVMTVNNDLMVTSDTAGDNYGIYLENYDIATSTTQNPTANVTIGGDVTVESTNQMADTFGIQGLAQNGNNANIVIGGNLDAQSAGGQTFGIKTDTYEDAATDITVEKNVTVKGSGSAYGISANNCGGSTSVTVDGDVSATTDSNVSYAYGVILYNAETHSIADIQIDGGLSVAGGGNTYGLQAYIGSQGTEATADIGKGISATGKGSVNGIYLTDHWYGGGTSSTVDINVGANKDGNAITVNTETIHPTDLEATSGININKLNTGEANINVEGNIVVEAQGSSPDHATGIRVANNAAGGSGLKSLNMQVNGDVTGTGAGIFIGSNNKSAKIDIVIDGTVESTGNNPAVVIADTTSNNPDNPENLQITAWKLESKNESLVSSDNTNRPESIENAAKKIQYILRVTQPEIDNTPVNTISLANADGSAWNKTKAWNNGEGADPTMLNVANEEEKVYVKLEVPAGYELAGVYADAEQTVALTWDNDKKAYYLVVPRGGGIDVNVALTLIQAGTAPVPNPASDETGVIADAGDNDITEIGSVDLMDEVTRAIAIINATPAGGTAQIAITSDRLVARLVNVMAARRDININLVCFVDGKLALIIIPAGTDLSGLTEVDGSVLIARIAEVFGIVKL